MTHALKTWPEYYKAINDGRKTFEIRKFDRDFKVGDKLLLQEYDPKTTKYTGSEAERDITYLMNGGAFGIEVGYVVLGIKERDY